jgi:hypothetical protein
MPFGLGFHVDGSLKNLNIGATSAKHEIRIQSNEEKIDVVFSGPSGNGSLRLENQAPQPISVVSNLGFKKHFGATCKSPGYKVSGAIVTGKRKEKDLQLAGTYACADLSFGYFPFSTRWTWANASSADLSLNLCQGIHEDFEKGFTENFVWANGTAQMLEPTVFTKLKEGWKITSIEGSLDLVFSPLTSREHELDFGVLSSRLQQVFGVFDGTIKIDKKRRDIKGLSGVVENFEGRW